MQTPQPDSLHVSDYLELMRSLPDSSVDMILTDIPYGVTDCSWDTPIDLAQYWQQVKRIITPRGAVVMTATQPLTTDLIVSNRQDFKYSWVWVKTKPTGFINVGNRPLSSHEDVLIFSQGTIANGSDRLMTYNPQDVISTQVIKKNGRNKFGNIVGLRPSHRESYLNKGSGYPRTILQFDSESNLMHPTQKPVDLFAYLIRTYTNTGDLILDPFCGSGTTAVAAKHEQRHYICGDISAEYIDIARKRVNPTFGEPPRRVKDGLPLSDLPLFEGLE